MDTAEHGNEATIRRTGESEERVSETTAGESDEGDESGARETRAGEMS
jgi:hypothetical protein